ncbi:MAG TPA: flagellar hook-associated protein 2, partial [Halothiobacillaceae bacterium]|nr:flagellar hook-associated protein 2 [Halothiobacillaceae bacterium]
MSGSGISISGIGSGLDVQAIVSQLVRAESAPKLNLLDRREARFDQTLSGLSKLKSAANDLSSAAFELRSLDTFRTRRTESSNEDIATATAQPGTALGSYALEVKQLASAQKLASGGFADASSTVGSGQMTIKSGENSFTIDVAATDSLNAIRDRINRSTENTSVQASIINVDDGAGGTEARLVLTARETGQVNAINVTVDDDDGDNSDNNGLSRLATENLDELTAAKDAQFTIDGLNVTSASNQVEGVIEGMTLNLKSAQPGQAVTIDVQTDNSVVMEALNNFVEKYNALNSIYSELTGYNAETEESGVLQGDSAANGLMRGLRSTLGGNIGEGALKNIADIGLQIDSKGQMSLDETKAENMLNTEPQAVRKFITAPGSGLARVTDDLMKPYLQFNGILDTRQNSVNLSLERIADQREALGRRMDSYHSTLLKQF